MYKVYFEDRKPIKAEKQSDVIYYFINHNAIGYEKLNNKSAYEELEEKYNRALKEKNKYKKIVKKAIEYIMQHREYYYNNPFGNGEKIYTDVFDKESSTNDLLEILQGDNKNE